MLKIFCFIMGIVIVALLAFGGSFAYFTAKTSAVEGTATVGTVNLSKTGSVTLNTGYVLPGSNIFTSADVVMTNSSNVTTYIAVRFTVKYSGDWYVITNDEGKAWTKQVGDHTFTSSEMSTLFSDDIELSIPATGYVWEQGSANKDIFVLRASGESPESTDYVIGDSTTVRTINVLNSSSAVTLNSNINRNRTDGNIDNYKSSLLEAGTVGDAYFDWEGATITLSIEGFQTQTVGVGSTSPASADEVWTAMNATGFVTEG